MTAATDSAKALSAPSLTTLLGCRGNLFAIAVLVWQGDGSPAAALDADSVYALAEWALDEVAKSNEGVSLARVCERFGQRPSEYIGLADPVLAYAFDVTCLVASQKDQEAEPPSEHGIRFTVPETGGE
jgi:hypothetical protein